MTKQEIIETTLKAMGWSPEENETVIIELEWRLPDNLDIKTCDDFKHFNVECCDTCHTFYAHYDMYLIDLSEGGNAWVCCAVNRAMFPKSDQNDDEATKLHHYIFGED